MADIGSQAAFGGPVLLQKPQKGSRPRGNMAPFVHSLLLRHSSPCHQPLRPCDSRLLKMSLLLAISIGRRKTANQAAQTPQDRYS